MSDADQPQDNPDNSEPSFLSHLIELRERLLKAVAAILIVLVVLVPFADRLYHLIAEPLLQRLPHGSQMIAIEVASPFVTPIKLAFVCALFLAMPVVLYQLWRFVAPGLYRHEKRLAIPMLATSVVMFYLGCAFAYFLVLPRVFSFLIAVTPAGVAMMTDINRYLSFVLTLFVAFGLSFEVPVVVMLLAAMGWITPEQLSKHRRYVILIVFVLAAIITPPDAFSMLMLAIPMCLLYELGVLAAKLFLRKSQTDSDAETGSD